MLHVCTKTRWHTNAKVRKQSAALRRFPLIWKPIGDFQEISDEKLIFFVERIQALKRADRHKEYFLQHGFNCLGAARCCGLRYYEQLLNDKMVCAINKSVPQKHGQTVSGFICANYHLPAGLILCEFSGLYLGLIFLINFSESLMDTVSLGTNEIA